MRSSHVAPLVSCAQGASVTGSDGGTTNDDDDPSDQSVRFSQVSHLAFMA